MAQEYLPGQTQFFKDIPVNSTFLEEIAETIQPSHFDSNAGLISFHVPVRDGFILNQIGLKTIIGVRKVDQGTGVESRITDADDQVAPIPAAGLLAFKQCDLIINGTVVEGNDGNFPYKSWFKLIGGHTSGALTNNQTMMFFYPDDPDNIVTTRAMTPAWKNRKSKVISADPVLFCILPFDCMSGNKMLPPKTELSVNLYHQQDAWRLQTATQVNAPYRFHVYLAELKIIRYVLNPSKIQEFYKCYSVDRPLALTYASFKVMGPYPMHKDTGIFNQRIRFGRRPTCLYIFFINSEASAGFFNTNPLYLRNLGLNWSQAQWGMQHEPIEGYKTRFSSLLNEGKLDVVDAYNTLRRSLGVSQNSKSTFLDFEKFVQGYTILCYKFSPLFFSSEFRQPQVDSNADLSISLNFSEPIAEATNMYAVIIDDISLIVRPNGTADLVLPSES